MKQIEFYFGAGAGLDAHDGRVVIEALREAAEMTRGSDEIPDAPLKRYVLERFADKLEEAL